MVFIIMKRYYRTDKLEYNDLKKLGIRDEAIDANYNNTDLHYFWTNLKHTEIGEADRSGYPTGNRWDVETFKVWFNEIEGQY